MTDTAEVIVVGGGIAGMSFATQLVDLAGDRALRIRILSKAAVEVSNSFAAQGGVAAVMRPQDSFLQHVKDTIMVGGGRNDPEVVRLVVREGPKIIRGLIGLGARFDADPTGQLALAREGGHSAARVVHHRDHTGEEIVRVLRERVRTTKHIVMVEHERVIDLLTEGEGADRQCVGVRTMNLRSGDITDQFASLVVLATGGAGQLYEHTTNPRTATGDGVAMAIRAGVTVRDMAFVQFHPTALYMAEHGPCFLISEAVRGAGARLRRPDGGLLMKGLHPMGDLAPRNVVARSIHAELRRTGAAHVWLDASPIGTTRFAHEFPAIDARCRATGLVPGRDPIPVMPAAHYMCGGVRTDSRGRTTLPRLLALGECASSGLHGADRLASNSLLEALVIPKRAAEAAINDLAVLGPKAMRPVRENWLTDRTSSSIIRASATLRHVMSMHVGIVRDHEGMEQALRTIARLERSIAPAWARRRWSLRLIELRDLLAVARSITEAAIAEPKSIGAHFVKDPAYA